MKEYYKEDARPILCDYVNQLSKELDIVLPQPRIRDVQSRGYVTSTTIYCDIKAPGIKRESLLDVMSLVTHHYETPNSFDSRRYRNLTKGHFEILTDYDFYGENDEVEYKRTVAVDVSYFSAGSGLTISDSGTASSISMPRFSLKLQVGAILDERDMEFVKKVYELVIPKNQTENPLDVFKSVGVKVIHQPENTLEYLVGMNATLEEVNTKFVQRLQNSDTREALIKATRKNPKQRSYNCAILYGPGGLGKTDTVEGIAHSIGYTLVKVSVKDVANKYIAEGPKAVARVFDAAKKQGGVLILLDEAEGIARNRSESHPEYGRMTTALMEEMQELKGDVACALICNNLEWIDANVLRRAVTIEYTYPDKESLSEILHHYATHLKKSDIDSLVDVCPNTTTPFQINQAADLMIDLFLQTNPKMGEKPDVQQYRAALVQTFGTNKKRQAGFHP